jgi:hypothetical protein
VTASKTRMCQGVRVNDLDRLKGSRGTTGNVREARVVTADIRRSVQAGLIRTGPAT